MPTSSTPTSTSCAGTLQAAREMREPMSFRIMKKQIALFVAAISLASNNPHAIEFVKELWESKNEPFEDGYFDAYYDGLLRLFAFMHLSGKYRVIEPVKK